jgi:hypothetical protein
MSSSPPPTANEIAPVLSAEALAECELLEVMSSSPPPLNDDEDEGEVLADEDLPSTSTTVLLTTPSVLRNQLTVARRKATQFKLHPYQRDLVEEFVKVIGLFWTIPFSYMYLQGSSEFKQTMLYIEMFVVENQATALKAAAPPFVSSVQLLVSYMQFSWPVAEHF